MPATKPDSKINGGSGLSDVPGCVASGQKSRGDPAAWTAQVIAATRVRSEEQPRRVTCDRDRPAPLISVIGIETLARGLPDGLERHGARYSHW